MNFGIEVGRLTSVQKMDNLQAGQVVKGIKRTWHNASNLVIRQRSATQIDHQ